MMPGECTDTARACSSRVDEVQHQRLDVAVEDQADHLGVAVDHRAAGVAADDVGRADEVERRLQVELVLALDPARRQIERRLVVVLRRPLVQPGEVVSNGIVLPSSS